MDKSQIEVLNITQEVFRGLLTALMAASNGQIKAETLATTLQALSALDDLSPASRAMLENLSQLPHVLHKNSVHPH